MFTIARNTILACGLLALVGLVACEDSQVTTVTYQTLKKAVANFGAVLVRFEESYPSKGDLDKEFKQLANDLRFTTNLLVAEVKVPFRSESAKDEEVSEERLFAEKLNAAKTEDFPVVFLFKRGQLDSPIRFDKKEDGSNFKVASLREFIRTNVPTVRLLLESCIESLDEIASKFSCSKATDEKRKALLKEAEAVVAKLTDDQKQSGKMYLKVMERVVERGTMFLTSERQRITNLLSGQMSEQKKKQLQSRLNILESFQSATAAKDEL